MKAWFVSMMAWWSITAEARVDVLFHPYEPTLEKIAEWISEAESTIDIAMYNMETSQESPVIRILASDLIQKRLREGSLRVRVILELYGSDEANFQKRQALEDLGLDVRFLGQKIKAHHKFAVIDARGAVDRVITGSANWSLSSYRGYNENILFFTQEPEATSRYQQEFQRLWHASQEFGVGRDVFVFEPVILSDQSDLEIYFNSPRFLERTSSEPAHLTTEVVRLINQAESHLEIATTRIRLEPILEALRAAADRGVVIEALISQDDYRDLGRRAKYLFGHKNIHLRVKFYNLNVDQYMQYQMHNKFMIVDGKLLVTGSFNWSKSSENNHIENMAVLTGDLARQLLPSYQKEFRHLFDLGRGEYPALLDALKARAHEGCAIPEMSLYVNEIRALLKHNTSCL